MKGVLLAGGTGSRLYPLTKVTNKHLLPVYDRPMIFYPLRTLKAMGCKEILVISGREHCGHILSLLGSGKEYGLDLSYEIQEDADGIAGALDLARDFANGANIAVCLGDNVFEQTAPMFEASEDFTNGATIFLKKVHDPERFGVAEIDETNGKVVSIEEKPAEPKSNYAVTGLYIYDSSVFEITNQLEPSARGELEITDVNNWYLQHNKLNYQVLDGWWTDAGTFESLHRAASLVRDSYVNYNFNL